MDGAFDDLSGAVSGEEVREFVKGVKALWKKKKGAIFYICESMFGIIYMIYISGKLKGWWKISKKESVKSTQKATKKATKAPVKQPETRMTATTEANKKKKEHYDNLKWQFCKQAMKGVGIAAGLIAIGIVIYKCSSYYDVPNDKTIFELEEHEEDFMDTIEGGIKRIQKAKDYNERNKKIEKLKSKIDKYLEENGVSKIFKDIPNPGNLS